MSRIRPSIALSVLCPTLLALLLWSVGFAFGEPDAQAEGAAAVQTATATLSPMVQATQTMEALASTISLRSELLLHDQSLIRGESCAPPCWRGITPGVTSWDDAVEILRIAPDLEDPILEPGLDGISQTLTVREPGGTANSGTVLATFGDTVDTIILRFAPDMSVSDLLARYGDPAYALSKPFSQSPPQAIINLIYPDVPMVVYAFVEGEGGSLGPSSEIVGAYYLTPGDMQSLVATVGLVAWQGFAPYLVYSDERASIQPTRPASGALTPAPVQTMTATPG